MLQNRAVPLLLALSLALLTGAWIVGNPTSAAPDEVVHYIKALGAGRGELVGNPPPQAQMHGVVSREAWALTKGGEPASTAEKIALWQWRTSRAFTVPAGALSTGFNCNQQQEDASWACLTRGHSTPDRSRELLSYVGTYPPFVYMPSGLLTHASSNPSTRLLLGRAGMAVLALILFVGAVLLLWDPETGGLSLVGLLLAVTPMVVFISSALTASGPEVASSICFAASLIRLGRDQRATRWVWAMYAFSGIALALSRQLGAEFVVMQLLATALVLGWRQIPPVFRSRKAGVASVVVLVGCGIGLFWDMHFNVHPPLSLGAILAVLPSSVKELASITRQEIGNFGALDSPLPWPAYLAWLVMLGVLLVIALRVSPRPMAKRLGLLVVAVVAGTVLLTASQRQTGFSFQGRYVLPIFVLIPLWAGELVRRNAARLSLSTAMRLVVWITTLAGLIQAFAWYANGRRVAVGDHGSWLYALSSQWQPPLGWLPWTAVALAALGLSLVAARRGIPRLAPVSVGEPAGDAAYGLAVFSRIPGLAGAWVRPPVAAATKTSPGRD